MGFIKNLFGGGNSVPTMSAEQVKNIIDGKKPHVLLDVRSAAEYKEQHIKDALLIPENEIAVRAGKELPDKEALILTYCRSGVRSANAVIKLIEMGYKNAYSFGGIMSWPYDTISG